MTLALPGGETFGSSRPRDLVSGRSLEEGATDVTLQFVSWDLELSGTSSFIFRYRTEKFAKPTDYGLIK